MSGLVAAYHCRQPQRLIEARETAEAEREQWRQTCKHLIVEADPDHGDEREIWVFDRIGGGSWLNGYGPYPKPLPEGWRVDNQNRLVPRRQGAVGKAWAAKFDAIKVGPKRPVQLLGGGMPPAVMTDNHLWSPGLDYTLPGEVFVLWGADPEATREGEDIDPTAWERIKLSEYYAAIGQ